MADLRALLAESRRLLFWMRKDYCKSPDATCVEATCIEAREAIAAIDAALEESPNG